MHPILTPNRSSHRTDLNILVGVRIIHFILGFVIWYDASLNLECIKVYVFTCFLTIRQNHEVLLWRCFLFFLDVEDSQNRAETSLLTAPWMNLRYLCETVLRILPQWLFFKPCQCAGGDHNQWSFEICHCMRISCRWVGSKQNNLCFRTHTHKHTIHLIHRGAKKLPSKNSLGQSLGHGHLER